MCNVLATSVVLLNIYGAVRSFVYESHNYLAQFIVSVRRYHDGYFFSY